MEADRVTIRRGPDGRWEVLHGNRILGVFNTHAEAIAHVSSRQRLHRALGELRARFEQLTSNIKSDNERKQ